MKTLIKYLLISVLATIYLPLVTACDDDDPIDPYDINYVYIYPPSNTDNILSYKGNGTFLAEIAPDCVINPARCTKPAPEDLTIHIDVDPSLVDSYNQTHGTSYTLLKSVQLENPTLFIKKGEYISADTLKLHYTDMMEFQNGAENYLLPITITSITGSGVSISENSRIYFTFSSLYKANYVTIGTAPTLNLQYEDGGFTNLIERLPLDNIIQTSPWAADEDINVSLEIKQDMVEKYNAVNNTNYMLMPNATLEHSMITIKKGARNSGNSVAIIFSDAMANVEIGKNYILPISITAVDGVGAEIGEALTAYVIFKTIEKMAISVQNTPVGTAINDFSNWKITVDGKSESGLYSWMNLVTNPGAWYDKVSPSSTMDIDLGKVEKVSTVSVRYYYSGYAALAASISVSTDGINYNMGQCMMEAANGHHFVLGRPIEARYIRIMFPLSVNPWGTYPTALYVYKMN